MDIQSDQHYCEIITDNVTASILTKNDQKHDDNYMAVRDVRLIQIPGNYILINKKIESSPKLLKMMEKARTKLQVINPQNRQYFREKFNCNSTEELNQPQEHLDRFYIAVHCLNSIKTSSKFFINTRSHVNTWDHEKYLQWYNVIYVTDECTYKLILRIKTNIRRYYKSSWDYFQEKQAGTLTWY
ncbi:hypothetical protein AKO1_003826, partial [Acrasis kona]